MANQRVLTPSNIRYLLAMRELEQDGNVIRCSNIARKLGISRPSAHNMLDTFTEMGYINRKSNGVAFFTESGNDIAERYSAYYDTVTELLKNIFPGADNLQTAVCSLLAEISEESLTELTDRKKINKNTERS